MFDKDRLERLASAHLDGELTPDERAELERMLLSSSSARQAFLEQADFHGLLHEEVQRAQGSEWSDTTVKPVEKPSRWKHVWIAAGLAACLAVGSWLLQSPVAPRGAEPAETSGVALLGMAVDVEWEGRAFSPGEALPRGPLIIRSGLLRLDFYSGARVVLEGPASLELISPDLARLDRGKLNADVPPPAQGFTILNGDLRVVDRGTRFGMDAAGVNDCAVHVFDGEVELQGKLPETTARKLFSGDAVAIREGTSIPISADQGSFTDPAGVEKAAAQESEERMGRWRSSSQSFRATAGLLAYFDFENMDASTMSVANLANGAEASANGSVVGCEKLTGRWDGKAALGFAKTSDRVRFRLEGSTPSMTLMAWVRVDSLPLEHNSLFSMAPGELGEVHWKLDRAGRLLLGMRADGKQNYRSWERLESPRVLTPDDFGRWIHVATVIDGGRMEMRHFLNGREIAVARLGRSVPVRLGLGNLGNFDSLTPDSGVVRNFNGRMDEFALFGRALSADDIRGDYER